jgi:hypothetical protein
MERCINFVLTRKQRANREVLALRYKEVAIRINKEIHQLVLYGQVSATASSGGADPKSISRLRYPQASIRQPATTWS